MDKQEIREQIILKRNAMSPEERSEKSQRIAERLYEQEEYREAGSIFFFAGFGSEVETLPMIGKALSEGKAIALPRCVDEKSMVFHYIDSLENLHKGYKGILEPAEASPMAMSEPDICIVPGVAFDRQMDRIGYGRGYYDRFFKALPLYVPKIALAFSLQLVESIPYETLDETMDMIITEDEVILRPDELEDE